MKILLFRSNNIFDSRVNKYVNYYKRSNIDFTIIGWDRKNEGIIHERYDFFRYKAGTSVGGFTAIINHLRWMLFVYRYIKKHSNVTTIHACDLNSAFPAALYKYLHSRDLNIIFDACDWFSANFAHMKFTCKIFQIMEKFTCKWTNQLIICEPERKAQITFRLNKNPLILPNIPEIDKDIIFENNIEGKYNFGNNWPTFVYFGGLVNNRFLVELFNLARTEHFNMLVGGYGSAEIESLCEDLNSLPNFRYFGKLSMKEGLRMSYAADVIYAMYCKTNPNHIYAAPNKLYEAMFLSKPIITTKGTIVEKKVISNNIGWAIEENVEDLKSLILNLNKEQLKEKGRNSNRLWDCNYKNYVSDFFDNIYSKVLV